MAACAAARLHLLLRGKLRQQTKRLVQLLQAVLIKDGKPNFFVLQARAYTTRLRMASYAYKSMPWFDAFGSVRPAHLDVVEAVGVLPITPNRMHGPAVDRHNFFCCKQPRAHTRCICRCHVAATLTAADALKAACARCAQADLANTLQRAVYGSIPRLPYYLQQRVNTAVSSRRRRLQSAPSDRRDDILVDGALPVFAIVEAAEVNLGYILQAATLDNAAQLP